MQYLHMANTSKRKIIQPDLERKPYIVYNEYLQVWTGLKNGGVEATFSDNYDDAKPLNYESQFKHLQRISLSKLEKEYI